MLTTLFDKRHTQALRGLAILLILLYHLWSSKPTWFGVFGYQMVDVFVLLSGYATVAHWNTYTKFSQFYLHKFIKLYGYYWVAWLVLVLGHALLPSVIQHKPINSLAFTTLGSFFLQASGLQILYEELFFAGQIPWWYIGLAAQLYLVSPLLRYILRRISFATLFYASVVLLIAYLFLLNKHEVMHRFWTQGCIIVHLPAYIAGGWFFTLATERKKSLLDRRMYVPLALGLLAYNLSTPSGSVFGVLISVYSLGAVPICLLLLAILSKIDPICFILAWIGNRSFTLYLTHYAFIFYIHTRLDHWLLSYQFVFLLFASLILSLLVDTAVLGLVRVWNAWVVAGREKTF